MGRMTGVALLLLLAAVAPARAEGTADEAERLRTDMEGQSERLRLTLETFMEHQQARLDELRRTQDTQLGVAVAACAGTGLLGYGLGRRRRARR